MAKLTVYLPDWLDEGVKTSGVSPSSVCQRALAQAIVGPRVTVLRGGWCRVQCHTAEAVVRFDISQLGRLFVRELIIAGDALSPEDLASISIAGLTEWANDVSLSQLTQEIKTRTGSGVEALDTMLREEPVKRIEWGTDEDAIADLRPVPTTPNPAKVQR